MNIFFSSVLNPGHLLIPSPVWCTQGVLPDGGGRHADKRLYTSPRGYTETSLHLSHNHRGPGPGLKGFGIIISPERTTSSIFSLSPLTSLYGLQQESASYSISQARYGAPLLSVSKVLLVHGHSFTHVLWLLSHSKGRAESLLQRLYDHMNPKAESIHSLALYSSLHPRFWG